MKYGAGRANQDIQKKALYMAEHKAIECIKRGENVMLSLPDMYEPSVREQVNTNISKALKDTKYTSTAIVLDNTNEHMFKYTNSNFAPYMFRISSAAKDLIEKYPPSTDDKNCKYDFVVSDGLNKGRSISEMDPIEAETITEYMDTLDEAYREVFGSYDPDDYEFESYDGFEDELQEVLANEVSHFCNEKDIGDIEQ
jgi:hypothetical protein